MNVLAFDMKSTIMRYGSGGSDRKNVLNHHDYPDQVM